MSVLDFAALLQPVAGDAPCGRDLEYAPEMLELATMSAEPDEAAFKGVEVVDGRNWAGVRSRAERLLGQTKDIRVSAILARSLLHTHGVTGFCEALSLSAQLADRYWNDLYPALEGTDAIARLNAFAELWARPLLSALRAAPLVSVRGLGDFSLRDILTARGQEKPRPGANVPSAQHVQHALDAAPDLASTAASVDAALADLAKLDALVRERASDHLFDTTPLRDLLKTIRQVLPQAVAPAAPSAAVSNDDASPLTGSSAQAAPGVVYRERDVQNRDDVIALLDKICGYYEAHEPSSPVPLLMQRARKLVNMNFVELMKELADKGMPQLEAVAGKESK